MASKDRTNTAIKWISQVLGKSKWLIGLLLILQIIQGCFGIVNAFCLRQIVNDAASKDKGSFLGSFILFVLFILFQIVISVVYKYISDLTSSTVNNIFRGRLFSALLTGDFASVSQIHSGEWMNRLTSDVNIVSDGAVSIIPGFIGTIVRLTGALIALLWLEPVFIYILIPGGVILIGLTYLFRKVMKLLHKRIREADGKLRVFLQERIENLIIIHAFSQEKASIEQTERLMEEHKASIMKRSNFSNLCNAGFAGAMNGIYLLGVLFCGYGLLNGTMQYGNLLAVLQLVGQVQNPFVNITGYLPKYFAMIASAERIMEIENYNTYCLNGAKTSDEIHEIYDKLNAIGLNKACFTYISPIRDNAKQIMPLVLNDISLEIKKGEFVAFTGHSGCGKSTILKLLMCLYPLDSGERYLFFDKREELTSEWHRLFAYVPQGNQLMCGTIREIITFSDRTAMSDDLKIRNALEISCADEFVDELEDGIDTVLGEHGKGLSEGQMQRIAVARAVFSDNPVLLLDESTSALDEETERRLLYKIKSMTDKTVLIVTHKPAALEICDRILEFTEKGIEWRQYG